ncbi:MAG: hypothetical protein R3F02_13810 [Thiolinea sp.]
MHKPLLTLLLLLLLLPAQVLALSPPFKVQVDPEWGDVAPVDVKAVIDSATLAMAPYIGGRTLDNIIVRNDPKGPISLYQRADNGEYVVLLDVKGRYWSQLAYQFAHEACHLLSNYDLAPDNISRQQWFEESLCEAFSLFTLEQMAEQWQDAPPYPNWKSYAAELQKYADDIMQEDHRQMIPRPGEWYRKHRGTLEADPYAQDRKLNEKLATHLLQLFEKSPESWAAINYLNLGEDNGSYTLDKYLSDWYQNTPDSYQDIVAQIQQLLIKD